MPFKKLQNKTPFKKLKSLDNRHRKSTPSSSRRLADYPIYESKCLPANNAAYPGAEIAATDIKCKAHGCNDYYRVSERERDESRAWLVGYV